MRNWHYKKHPHCNERGCLFKLYPLNFKLRAQRALIPAVAEQVVDERGDVGDGEVLVEVAVGVVGVDEVGVAA